MQDKIEFVVIKRNMAKALRKRIRAANFGRDMSWHGAVPMCCMQYNECGGLADRKRSVVAANVCVHVDESIERISLHGQPAIHSNSLFKKGPGGSMSLNATSDRAVHRSRQ